MRGERLSAAWPQCLCLALAPIALKDGNDQTEAKQALEWISTSPGDLSSGPTSIMSICSPSFENWASLPAGVSEILEDGVGAKGSHALHASLLPLTLQGQTQRSVRSFQGGEHGKVCDGALLSRGGNGHS